MASAVGTLPRSPSQPLSPGARQRTVLATAMIGNFVLMMAISPISAIMPTIYKDFNADIALASWVMGLFFLALTSSVLIVGRLGDLFGHSKIFTIGTVLFSLSSLAGGFSQDIIQLIIVRGFQGVSAAMIMATGFALIGNNFPPNKRGLAVGLITTSTGLGGLIGTLLSTYVFAQSNWRGMFFVMAGLGVLGIFCANQLRKIDHERYPARIDFAGGILIFLTLATLSLSVNHLHEGGESFQEGWYYHIPMHILTLIFLSALVYVELRSPAPLIDFRIFKNGSFSAAVVANGICHSTMMGTTFLFPFLVEKGLGLGPRDTGVLIMSSTLMLTFSGIFGGWLYDRFRSPWLAPLGIGVVAGGLVLMGVLAGLLTYVQFVAIVIVLGVAMGVFFTVNNVMIISTLPNSMRGLASGMEQSSRQLGHTLGITVTSAAMAMSVPRDILTTAPPSAWVEGFQRATIIVAIVAAIGFVISIGKRTPARQPAARPAAAQAQTAAAPAHSRPTLQPSLAPIAEYPVQVGSETWTFVAGPNRVASRSPNPAAAD